MRQNALFVVATSIILVGLNLLLKNLNALVSMPFFFDTVGTALAAALFGLAPGVLVGIATNGLQEVFAGFTGENIPWALCSGATAAIVWAHVRFGRLSTVRDALWATLWVTLANAVLGAIIATYRFGGMTGVPLDYVVLGIVASGRSVLLSTFLARVPSNLIDKGITVFLTYIMCRRLRINVFPRPVNHSRDGSPWHQPHKMPRAH